MKLEQKLKEALNENRLLILGAQVVFGFQFNGFFQDQFDELPLSLRLVFCAGLALLIVTIGLFIVPSMQHRIVEGGHDSSRVLTLATACTGWALLPLAVALAADLFIAVARSADWPWDLAAAVGFFTLATMCWFGLAFWLKQKRNPMPGEKAARPTPLEVKVDQLLTEARLIIPGAQALLGFQLTATLTRAFAELPPGIKVAHAIALCAVGLAVIFLMAPASLHRIAFGGEDDPRFLKIGSAFVIAAPLALAAGIALDAYVAASRALPAAGASALGLAAIVTLLGLWYGYPVGRWLLFGPVRR